MCMSMYIILFACTQWNAQPRAVTVGNTLRTAFHMANSKSKTTALTEAALNRQFVCFRNMRLYIRVEAKYVTP
jgi:hypothetical protein